MTKINNLKIFVTGSLLLALLVAIFIKVNIDEKPKYNTCDGENIADFDVYDNNFLK